MIRRPTTVDAHLLAARVAQRLGGGVSVEVGAANEQLEGYTFTNAHLRFGRQVTEMHLP